MTSSDSAEPSDSADEEHNPKDCGYTTKKPNLWDRFTFGYLTGIIFKGSWAILQAKDLRPLHSNFTARNTSSRFLRYWEAHYAKQQSRATSRPDRDGDDVVLIPPENSQRSINMVALIVKTFWRDLCLTVLLELLNIFIYAIPPYLIGRFNDFLDDSSEQDYVGYYIAGVLLLSRQASSWLNAQLYGTLFDVGIKCRSGMSSAIYQKCLRLSSKTTKKYSTGDVINLVSVDLNNIMQWITLSTTLWSAPVSILFTFSMIYQYLGVYCLAGVVVAVSIAPLLAGLTKLQQVLQAKQMKKKDERVGVITEVFNNVKVLKLYAWENSFIQKIQRLRSQETRLMNLYTVVLGLLNFAWNCYPFMISTSAIAAYMFLDKKSVLNPKVVLVSIAYFNNLRFDLYVFPYAVSLLARALVSLKRVREFLEADEVDLSMIKEDLNTDEVISLRDATLSWSGEGTPELRDINVSIQRGELVAVVGSVAAGKSSLIQAIIGEMSLTQGSLNRRRNARIAYVPQQAWILNATVRSNITFGAPFHAKRYQEILQKCCLLPDLKILPAKDATEVGEKGINLSGGQKQRISLARAVYQDTEIYLLDDPLSAVDAHVAQDLFKNVIGPEGLLRDKTRILVTHSLAFLPHVDRVIEVANGQVTHQGTYEDVMQRNPALGELLKTHVDTTEESPKDDPVIEPADRGNVIRERTTSEISNVSRRSAESEAMVSRLWRVTEEEGMEVGSVRWKVYLEFWLRFGICGTLFTLAGYTLCRLADAESLFYITRYSFELKERNATTTEDMWNHFKIYLGFGGVQALTILIGTPALCLGCIWTSTSLHNKMLDAILRAPMSFFDSNPVGRILNRFSSDTNVLDLNLHSSLDGYLETSLVVIVCLILICIQLPSFVAILVPMFVIFLGVQQFYMASSRQIKRLNATTKSSVLNSYNEGVAGTSSIRAYGVQEGFSSKNMRFLDNNQNCQFHENNGYRWLALRVTLLGDLICFAICCVITYMRGEMTSWLGSLLLSFSLQASSNMTWIVRIGAQVENSFVSAERVLEYGKTQPEAAWYVKDDVSPDWPSRGEVQIEEYSTKYRENLDLVLRKINLRIAAGEKIGIVGRTGAGKSSLTLALLRIIEAVDGRILIDGIDISRIGLHTLRSRLAMIPQDPVLFAGTLRENVDPEEKYTDEQVWAALERAHMKSENKPITYKVTEGGSNLSVGERQLICLARALLRNSKILILDEATAAVDLETDRMIQKTIREDFKTSTIITIAHRLHTIMDYDRIVVLDRGEIREIGSPRELLSMTEGIFSSMAKNANIRVDAQT